MWCRVLVNPVAKLEHLPMKVQEFLLNACCSEGHAVHEVAVSG